MITLENLGMSRLEWKGKCSLNPPKNIFSIRAKMLIERGSLVFLAHFWDTSGEVPPIGSIYVVFDLLMVFPSNLLGMPPTLIKLLALI